MLEPSNPRPSSKTVSSSLPTGIVKCCDVPKRSVNRRSTAFTSFSRHNARTSRGVMAERGQKLLEKRAGGDNRPPLLGFNDSWWRRLTTHLLTTHYLMNNISWYVGSGQRSSAT